MCKYWSFSSSLLFYFFLIIACKMLINFLLLFFTLRQGINSRRAIKIISATFVRTWQHSAILSRDLIWIDKSIKWYKLIDTIDLIDGRVERLSNNRLNRRVQFPSSWGNFSEEQFYRKYRHPWLNLPDETYHVVTCRSRDAINTENRDTHTCTW